MLRLADVAIRQDKNIAARAQYALAPVMKLQRFRNIAALIAKRDAKMQTQRILHVKIDRQDFAACAS